jgi:NAD(P)H-dependent flavin oxidoreductase YrpB (nitropropane dioxygenase family)
VVNRDSHSLKRAVVFCDRFGLRLPILLAPMAGTCPPSTSIAVMRAGGMGACGALLMQPKEIEDWADIVAALWPERCKGLVSVSGYLIASQESGKMPLPPKAELQWWYQFYFATERSIGILNAFLLTRKVPLG